MYGIKLSHAAETHAITEACLGFRLTLLCTVCSLIEIGTMTFFGFRSSHSEMPTSSKLKTSSVGRPGTNWLMHANVCSHKQRGISSRWLSCGEPFAKHKSPRCRPMKEFTHPRVVGISYSAATGSRSYRPAFRSVLADPTNDFLLSIFA
jgi:hypothetical protein